MFLLFVARDGVIYDNKESHFAEFQRIAKKEDLATFL